MQGQTALHWAARRGYATVVAELLQHGADVHAIDCEVSHFPPASALAELNTSMMHSLQETNSVEMLAFESVMLH